MGEVTRRGQQAVRRHDLTRIAVGGMVEKGTLSIRIPGVTFANPPFSHRCHTLCRLVRFTVFVEVAEDQIGQATEIRCLRALEPILDQVGVNLGLT